MRHVPPADIEYPTDLKLLNAAREKLEAMIDTLHRPFVGHERKPRSYRKKARKQYLGVSKQRRPGIETVRKGVRQQLRYVQRNLKHVTALAGRNGLKSLSHRQCRNLLVIQELYRQQKEMFESNSARIEGRIVSISQPHVRPIVRGKINAPVEFGAKLSVSLGAGYAFLDHLSWRPHHEGKFGEGKRRYGLGRISACLQKTSETVISLNFLIMNIGKMVVTPRS